ncbi:hypothetical protein PtrSN002B_004575 [Pyrenophora tritici-repentis]|uniref:Uncharacterized protein n=2 Tax=Pyrenophora tritici-repentis TaxID=45151 RepID=A0A2W1G0S4_9PLEO|nr:uncharacterized protein PTRG_11231 [Pyrenophora tritici-repentis Pt-1C-BFP]KAA8622365.1 hypothetical protein PtrV1_03671 [Pyrenophora tritici-repentis]EDU44281.1 predicted protein [Pyrenophora tritici-repentis Pt-1C-BFP]KAF7451349.1 hypothetical protein A1F99_031260 [Pyrenophora tritici-repentis]KAF7575545.1 hypothetical protein PtrM4_071690 [Pyrenophora tritici-repentis]KAG9385711.1 hypothetical protein A1F94_002461 [Pyrenophora tritici-repentis]
MHIYISAIAGLIAIAAAAPPYLVLTLTETITISRCVVWGPLPPQVTYTTEYTYNPPDIVTTVFTNNPIQRVTVTSCSWQAKRSEASTVTSTLYTDRPTQTVTDEVSSITSPPAEIMSVHPVSTEPAIMAPMPTVAETYPFTFTLSKRHTAVVNETQSLIASTFITNNQTKTVSPFFTTTVKAKTFTNDIMTLSVDLTDPFSVYKNPTPTKTPDLARREEYGGNHRIVWGNSDCVACLDWTECIRCSGTCANCVNLFCRDPFGGDPMCVSLERLYETVTGSDYNLTFHDFVGYTEEYTRD